jgi:hypothetical protein
MAYEPLPDGTDEGGLSPRALTQGRVNREHADTRIRLESASALVSARSEAKSSYVLASGLLRRAHRHS